MEWASLLSTERFGASAETLGGRSEFQKDVDKIVFSSSFRRLQRKTQVHPQPRNDHVHTRLTHSLEVSSVGRTIGTLIGEFVVDELPTGLSSRDVGTVVQAACLLHDVGNPPFGHAGEDAISEWFRRQTPTKKHLKDQRDEFENFEGNAQGFRIAAKTEYAQEYGMNLTYAVLASFMKYPRGIKEAKIHDKVKYGFFESEKIEFETVFNKVGLLKGVGSSYSRHPLAYAVEAADDICYAIVDLEDGFELNILTFDDIFNTLEGVLNAKQKENTEKIKSNSARQALKYVRGIAVECMIREAIQNFKKNYSKIMEGKFSSAIIEGDGPGAKAVACAKKIARDKIFLETRKTQLEIGSYACMSHLLNAFSNCVEEVYFQDKNAMSFQSKRLCDLLGPHSPLKARENGETVYVAYRQIVDHVAGMTDDYAVFLANQISGNVH